jgi:hypothetical protein
MRGYVVGREMQGCRVGAHAARARSCPLRIRQKFAVGRALRGIRPPNAERSSGIARSRF